MKGMGSVVFNIDTNFPQKIKGMDKSIYIKI